MISGFYPPNLESKSGASSPTFRFKFLPPLSSSPSENKKRSFVKGVDCPVKNREKF